MNIVLVKAARSAIPMLVPPYIEQHTDETIALAKELLRITKEIRVLAGQYHLYLALTRSSTFAKSITESGAADGVNIVVGSLLRTMVVSIVRIFDRNERTSNLPKIIKKALQPKVVSHLQRFHEHYGVSAKAEISRARLTKYQRKLKSGWVR